MGTIQNTGTASARYLRHEQIEGFSQPAIQALRVLVIGAGAIGNEVVKNLTLLGAGRITLFDFDRVEIHNLTRSVLLRSNDIGKNKAHCVAQRARELDPAVQVDAISGDIHDTLTLAMVREADIIIACTDNFNARIRINHLCWLTGTPWINTAIDSRYGSVELFPFDSSDPCACYECTLPSSVYEKLAERQSCGGLLRAALAEQVMPTTTITTSLCAALACNEALRHTGCDSRESTIAQTEASRIFIDSMAGASSRSTIGAAQMCAACGILPKSPPTLGIADSGSAFAELVGADNRAPALLSDKIIWHCACEQCGPSPELSTFIGQRAASLSDAITVCARCRRSSVKVEVREQFSVAELAKKFMDHPIPAKWAIVENRLIEFTHTEHTESTPTETRQQ